MRKLSAIISKFGPGLLYAAAAIGVSHLVQSTRAGALFGIELIYIIVLANIIKYPFFKIGPLYTAATGKTLLDGYKKLGSWAIILFFIMTLSTMFTVQAAVTVVTAGIANSIFNLNLDIKTISSLILLICAIILFFGRYQILDNLVKVIIIVLTITTFISVLIGFNAYEPPQVSQGFSFQNKGHIFFLIALVGWMPAPLDVPIWHSLWSKEKSKEESVSLKDAITDFNVGYIGTALLAICFLLLGAFTMHPTGKVFSQKATLFSAELIQMYTQAIGEWSYPIIALAAFSTMFSTSLTCLDAFPRILNEGVRVLKGTKEEGLYRLFLVGTFVGTCLIFTFFLSNMRELVNMATTISFVVAPLYAILSFLIINDKELPKNANLSSLESALAKIGIAFLSLFSLYYLYQRFL